MNGFTRGFRLHLRGGQVLDGAAFPSGRCLVIDDPQFGLASVAASEEELLRGYPDARIEWPDTEGTAVHQLADAWRTQPDRYAPLQELLAALAAARTT
jgi:hypothetical protein